MIKKDRKLHKLDNILEDDLTKSYLKYRKALLQKSNNLKEFLVPHIGLHAIPTLDFIPFKLPKLLVEYL